MLKIDNFNEERDLELFTQGELEACKESFPGLSIPTDMFIEIRENIKNINNYDEYGLFTALDKGLPIGCIIVTLSPFYSLVQGHIQSVYVQAKHRQQGLAKALFVAAEQWAKERGAFAMKLDVSIVNETAITAYKSIGYSIQRLQMEKLIKP